MLDSAFDRGVATQAVDLGPAGHAGLHEVARQVVRDLGGKPVDVIRPFGSRSDQAHLPTQHVPELRQLVEIPVAHDRADAQQPRVATECAGVGRVRGVRIRCHAAELVERERPVAGSNAGLSEKHRSGRRFAFDQRREHGHHGQREQESHARAGEVQQALEPAVEETRDRQLFHAEHWDAPNGLQAEAAEKNVERAGNDLPLDVGPLAGFDDALQLGAGQIEPCDDQQIGPGPGQHLRELLTRA